MNKLGQAMAIGALAAGVNACGDDASIVYRCGSPMNGKQDIVLETQGDARKHCFDALEYQEKVAAVTCKTTACNTPCNPDQCGQCQYDDTKQVTCEEIINQPNGAFDEKYQYCVGNSSDVCTPYIKD